MLGCGKARGWMGEGHVRRPSTLPWRDGVRLGELLGSAQGVLPPSCRWNAALAARPAASRLDQMLSSVEHVLQVGWGWGRTRLLFGDALRGAQHGWMQPSAAKGQG